MATAATVPVLLYVEDDALIRMSLDAALEEAGFRVVAANGGAEAMELLAGQAQSLHGLITDINLGDGPDGWLVARKARNWSADSLSSTSAPRASTNGHRMVCPTASWSPSPSCPRKS